MDYSNFEEFIGPLIFAIIAWLSNYFSKKKKPPSVPEITKKEKEESLTNEFTELYENLVSPKEEEKKFTTDEIISDKEEEKILDLNEPLPSIQDKNIIEETKFSSINKKEPSKVISDNKQERIIKKAKKNKLNKNGIREKLKSKNGLREAFILKEILDKKY